MNGFYLNRNNYNEGLDLDYVSEANSFNGNIGVSYDEESSDIGKQLFKFCVLKSHDTINHRFYKKEKLDRLYTLDEVETMYGELFTKCLDIYRSLEEKELTESIDFME